MKNSMTLSSSVGGTTLQNTKMDKLTENNLKKIQEHVSNFYVVTQCSGFCQCHICKQKYQIIDKGKQFMRQTSSLNKIDTGRVKSFYKLMSSVNNKVSFRLDIPTICFFQKGQCKLMFKSRNQYITMQQNAQVSKKNIANFFVQASWRRSGNVKINTDKANHIRNFSAVVPSYIHGTNEQNAQMREAKNFQFHTDKRLQGDTMYVVEKSTSQQVTIIRFSDNKGYQLLNQKQLRQLLKSASNARHIDFIQSYIRPHEIQSQFFYTQYQGYCVPENQLMYQRSLTHIRHQTNILSKYSKDFVPIQHLESYQQVLKQIPQQYILYLTYKMVHYLEVVRNIKVRHLTTVWLKDEFREIRFFGILNFQYDQNSNEEQNFIQIYGVKQMLDKPFNQLENQLLKMWENMKTEKLSQIQDKNIKINVQSDSCKYKINKN